MTADVISPDLKTVLRRLRLSRMLDTLPERLTAARQHKLPHQEWWSSQDLVEAAPLWPMSCFELLGTEPTEMAMTACSIVERVDVVGHVGDRQFSILVDLFLDPLLFQTAEERFGDGFVPTVALPAHTRLKVSRAAESLRRDACCRSLPLHRSRNTRGAP